MKFKWRQLLAVVLAITAMAMSNDANAQLVGLWEFENSGNLNQATIGSDLVTTGAILSRAGSGGTDVGGASVALDQFFTVTNPIGANGGGTTKTNEFTFVMDINDASDGFNALWDMDEDGTGTDADFFINGDDGVGIGGNYVGTINDDTWRRLVVVYDLGSADPITTFIDGNLNSTIFNGDAGIDDRFGLQSTFTLFSDNGGGEEIETFVSNFALFENALSVNEAIALGVAGDPIVFNPIEVLTVEIDRDLGAVTLSNNDIGAAQAIKGYSITSAAGALIELNYTPLADGDANWLQSTAPGATDDLSEVHLTTGTIADGASIMLDDGTNGAWLQYWNEDDIKFEYLDGNGDTIVGEVIFSGSAQTAPFAFGDLNFDGSLDLADWNVYIAGLGTDLTGMTIAEAYSSGDMTGDIVNDYADFLSFKAAFETANGVGSFEGMLASVPEPSSLLLGLLLAVGLVASRVRLLRPVMSTVAVALVFMVVLGGQANAQLVGLWEFENSGNLSLATIGSDLVLTGSDTAVAGSGGTDTGASALDNFANPGGGYYTVLNSIGANGGGTRTNSFTLLMDFQNPGGVNEFNGIYEFDGVAASDSDYFSDEDGPGSTRFGVGSEGYVSTANEVGSAWNRLVLSVENGVARASYVNGVLLGAHDVGTVDGRWSLDGDFEVLWDRDGGEEILTNISNLALFGTGLSSLQVSQLGVAGDPIFFSDPNLTLEVNKTTGSMKLINKSGFDFSEDINFYEITSAGGALNKNGWFSFDAQNFDSDGFGTGQSWDEGGGSDSNLLTEAFLLGGSSFADTDSAILGTAFDPSVFGASDGDLEFFFGLADSGSRIQGIVEYVTGGFLEADFDQDGDVDATDLQTLRTAFGVNASGDTDGDGDTDGRDFMTWQRQFSPGALSAGVAVPEPSTLGLLGMLAVGLTMRLAGRSTGRKQ